MMMPVILLLGCSKLSPQEQASVLTTNGKLGDKGAELGNNDLFEEIAEALAPPPQWWLRVFDDW